MSLLNIMYVTPHLYFMQLLPRVSSLTYMQGHEDCLKDRPHVKKKMLKDLFYNTLFFQLYFYVLNECLYKSKKPDEYDT